MRATDELSESLIRQILEALLAEQAQAQSQPDTRVMHLEDPHESVIESHVR